MLAKFHWGSVQNAQRPSLDECDCDPAKSEFDHLAVGEMTPYPFWFHEKSHGFVGRDALDSGRSFVESDLEHGPSWRPFGVVELSARLRKRVRRQVAAGYHP